MTPGARVQAAIEILDAIALSGKGRGGAPADAVFNGYARSRRYIGSKDRAFIGELVYGVLRHRAQLDWWLAYARQGASRGTYEPTARRRVLAALAILHNWTADQMADAFSGGQYGRVPLSEAEAQLAAALAGRSLDHPEQPDAVRLNCPEWLLPALHERFGDAVAKELRALNTPAPVDLRANILKGNREAAAKALAHGEIRVQPTRLSPWGLRVEGRPNLPANKAFKAGIVEIQDEGSQLAALLVGAKAGMRVCDFCAGAGGKSLAIAAAMQNKGHIVACDVSGPRLEHAGKRLRRADVHNVEARHLESERDPWVKRHAGAFDRVLVDAPCTGTGTWRRNPDARWRLLPEDVAELTRLQASILGSAARLVKPGGRLIYATCSLLPMENERQADAFAEVPGFTRLPISQVWAETIGGSCPSPDPYLRLSPARDGTDGFFVAVFERTAGSAES